MDVCKLFEQAANRENPGQQASAGFFPWKNRRELADYLAMRLARLLLITFCLFLMPRQMRAAEPGEVEAYNLAATAFADRFFEVAEKQFGEFRARFPKSPEAPNASLLQAKALAMLKKPAPALELLDANLTHAGPLADQFLLLKAEIQAERADHAAAKATYQRILNEFPMSPFRLPAAYGLAGSYFETRDYTNALQTLRGPFQQASAGSTNIILVARGTLLLGETMLQTGQAQEAALIVSAAFPPGIALEMEWRRHNLLARLHLSSPKPENAFDSITNAVHVAQRAVLPALEAQTLQLQAEIYKKMNQPERAITVYEKITAAENLPADQKRLGLLKAVELYVDGGRLTNAITRLEGYLTQVPQDPATDLLRLRAAELWMQRFSSLAPANRASGGQPDRAAQTNALAQSRQHLNVIINQLTNSVHLGKAYLNLGWTLWEEGTAFNDPRRIGESQLAFQTAFERLTRSEDQAMARLKWADAQLQQKLFLPAMTNYQALLTEFQDMPSARQNLLDKAHQNRIRAALELADFEAASAALGEMRNAFPHSPRTEQTILLMAQYLAQKDHLKEARASYAKFSKDFPQSSLLPEAVLSEAKTYSLEQNWNIAIDKYNQWIGTYTNHVSRPQAEFERAWLNYQAGNYPVSLTMLTNFITAYPTNRLAPSAQNLLADYYWDQQKWNLAEQNYQRIFQNTNWPAGDLAYEARLMAARTAFLRENYADARGYLTNLIADLEMNPAHPLFPEAWFAYGDVVMEQRITESTNVLNNFIAAAKVFDLITIRFKNTRMAVLAAGKKGDCHLQLAVQYPDSWREATNAYLAVIESKLPDIPVSARNQAEVGLALVLEKLSETKSSSAERSALLQAALARLLNVVHAPSAGKPADPLWMKKAALTAARISENIGDAEAALSLYRRLTVSLPSLRATWEARIQALQARQL